MTTRSGSAVVTTPSDLEIVITRVFDAPAQLVFEAWTNPEHVRRWWGPRGTTMTVCEIDLRVGGKWRYVISSEDGAEHAFHGEYLEIDRPRRISYTWVYEGFPDVRSIETATLVEKDGQTTMTGTTRHTSKENRDGHLNSGMEGGMQETMDRLDELLSALR